MRNEKNSITKLMFNIISITLILITSHTYTYANDSNNDVSIKTVPIYPSSQDQQHLYDELKSTNKDQRLFFNNNRLNLSGLTLLSLLADLGIRDHPILTNDEIRSLDVTDKALTLALYHIASQSQGNQLKSAANKPADFKAALNNDTLSAYIDSAMPQFNAVIRLRQAINKYKRMKDIDWPPLTDTFNPQLGQGHAEVKILRHKLMTLDDLNTLPTSKHRLNIFDQSIIDGIKHFQRRNGFKLTGKLNGHTINVLNQSIDTRINKLQVNLWRWLSLPRTPPTKYIMVNIPAFDLTLIDKGEPVMEMKVIVGKPSNQTPVMITEVNSVTLNPTWTPTRNIINNDLLPLHNKNNTALKSLNFHLATGYGVNTVYKEIPANLQGMLKQYRLVQKSGNNNALGKVRFNIKNNNAIFLHDTPTKHLFNRHNRALSHGCIRLQKPNDLLASLLISSSNNNKPQTKHVRLPNSLPVFITYQTAWIDNLGKINFRNDLYKKDK
ncbi:L,D-transpeptidase family protein [Moritella sp. Urea-trap-13]|uniref:L,D-transpeptidase family protein n=1 Tax=Moritella sp. Urea-trap-13 TaxID=2058327 RepID=UPI000C34319C|nr:L,D-transpeptidase family protein [Moritella sp. Urea-trap-13]PKH06291.1 murein L,D-transpeptidase [Moritella sp. Urea-trap-13]